MDIDIKDNNDLELNLKLDDIDKLNNIFAIDCASGVQNVQDVVIHIKRPWWAFWRKDKEISMPSSTISLGSFETIDGIMTQEINIKSK